MIIMVVIIMVLVLVDTQEGFIWSIVLRWCVTCLTAVMFNRRGRGGLYRGTTSKRRVECVGEG